MQSPSHYGYGSYEDEPFHGRFESVDAAAIAGFEHYPDAENIWVCEGYPVRLTDFIHGNNIIDNIVENAGEEVGEVTNGWLEKVPNEKVRELEQLIADWIMREYPPKFWLAKNIKQVFRKDYPESTISSKTPP